MKEIDIAQKAKEFATLKHQGQKRKNGDPYISHPIMVAKLLNDYKVSHNIEMLTAAAYLHDTLEDTDATHYELVDNFGCEIASMVMELTTNEDMKKAIGKEKYLAYKLKHMTKWALVIKLCDRLANVSDLQDANQEFRERYIKETNYIIEYISENRELTQTHKNIIAEINNTIAKIKR